MYLGEKAGQYLGTGARNRWEVTRWVFFHATNVAITFSAFNRAPVLESRCRDLLEAMNTHLADHEFFAGNYSVADMVPITRFWDFKFDAFDLDDYPHIQRWRAQLVERPAVRHAMEVSIAPETATQ
jgi:glutathione S-transferase